MNRGVKVLQTRSAAECLNKYMQFINSLLFTRIVLQQANITGGKGEGFLSNIPLIAPTQEVEAKIEELYYARDKATDPEAIDAEVEAVFCSLYGLTQTEIDYIYQ